MNNKIQSRCGNCTGCSGQPKEGRQCGQGGCCASGGCRNREITITEREKDFLMLLAQIPFLPVARFVKKSTASEQPESEALAPVYLNSINDSIETVEETGLVLRVLEDKRLITLDYDKPLQNGDYSVFEESTLYKDFCSSMEKSCTQDGYDLPVLECGSIALTSLGQEVLDTIEILL